MNTTQHLTKRLPSSCGSDLQLQMDAESLMQTAACVKLCVKHEYVDDVL